MADIDINPNFGAELKVLPDLHAHGSRAWADVGLDRMASSRLTLGCVRRHFPRAEPLDTMETP